MGLVKEQESEPKRCERRGEAARSWGAGVLARSLGVLSVTETPLKSSEQRNDMTSIILQRPGCYMENEIRIWKLIQKRLQCKEELRYFLLIPTYFSFMGSFFQPWTSEDVLGEGRRPVSLVLFHLPSLDPGCEMSFYVTGLIGVPCHLNTMTWKARSAKDTPYPEAAVSATEKTKDRNAHT